MQRNHSWVRALTALVLFSTLHASAQYSITPLSAGSIYTKSQLWNLSLTNGSSSTVRARLELEMKDIQNQQAVLSAATGTFDLLPGVRAVQMQALEPIIYNYAPGVVPDPAANGVLPAGKYQVCYRLVSNFGENQSAVADDCEEMEVEPLSPPVLTMPEDDSAVATANPSFTWVPPAPLSMFNNLTYDILISEVYEGQSLTDAIQKNLPLQQAQGLQQPFFSFPLQGPPLEAGKKYAWQVVATDQSQYAAKSEVWCFRMPAKLDDTAASNLFYLSMNGRSNAAGLVDGGILRVKYVSSVPGFDGIFIITDEKGGVMQSVKKPIKQGNNYLDLTLNGGFQSRHSYSVSLREPSGRLCTLTFIIK